MSDTDDSAFVKATRKLVEEMLKSWQTRQWDAYEDARIKAELQEIINEPDNSKS